MSNELKKSKNKQEQSNIEVAIINTAFNKDGKMLDDITQGRNLLEYMLDVDYIDLTLAGNGIDEKGNRYDPKTGLIISEKGKKQKPVGKKIKAVKEIEEDNEK